MKKYLVIGNPINHSLSPKLHNHWLQKNNIKAVYDKKQLNEIDLEEIFENTKIKNKQLSNLYKNKELILKDFFKRIDSILEKKIKKTDLGVNIKDNLFEIIMIRFEK